MRNLTKLSTALMLIVAIILPGISNAQNYYPPQQGYYQQRQQPRQRQYPYYQQQQRYYPQQYHQQYRPQQTQPRPEQSQPRKPAKKKDISGQTPPDTDISTINGPFMPYTWDYEDTLADLARAAGITPNQVLALNNLSLGQLRDGQVLKIPEIHGTSASLDIQLDPQLQSAREVWRGIRGGKRVALTFDAGGEPDGLDILLENLINQKAAATFFVTGKFAEDHPDLIRNIDGAGFQMHNHSWSHPEFTTITDKEIAAELSKTDDIVSSITGLSTKPYWRPPFGDRDTRVKETAAAQGYRSIYWTLDSLDSLEPKKSAEFVTNRILSPPKARADPDHYLDGAIILMHVGETGTANAVPQIVSGLRERGFTLVTVDEILRP